jgi:tRNA nucleotidyltransferase (CCA-adding enzyme)
MIKGRNPLLSIQLIQSLSLYNSIFWLPTPQLSTLSASPLASSYAVAATTILQYLLHENDVLPRPHPSLTEVVLRDEEARRRIYLGAMLTPYGDLTCKEGKKQKEVSAAEAIVREGLKVGNRARYLDSMAPLFRAVALLSEPSPDKFKSSPRATIGLLLRDKSVHNALTGSHWSSSLLFALVQDLVRIWNAETDEMDGMSS